MTIATWGCDDGTLDRILPRIAYRPDWKFEVSSYGGSNSRYLRITVRVPDGSDPERVDPIFVSHSFPVPPIACDEREWVRWVYDCVGLVERHESGEFFRFDGYRPFEPAHGPNVDVYAHRETWPS